MKHFLKKLKGSKKSKSQGSTRDPSPGPPETTLRDSLGLSTGPSAVDLLDDVNPGEENSSKTYELISDWLTEAATIGRDVSEATPVLAPLKSACLLIIRGLNAARSVHNNNVAWKEMVEDIQPRVEKMAQDSAKLQGRTGRSTTDNDLLVAMDRYLKSIKVIMIEAKGAMDEVGRMGTVYQRFPQTQIDGQRIQRLREIEAKAHDLYQSALGSLLDTKVEYVREVNKGLVSLVRQARKDGIWKLGLEFSGDLELAISLASGSELEKCEPGTRVGILTQIRDWAKDDNTAEQVFWLKDAAGTGKSTVAATMAGEWLQENTLGGRFFFSPNILLNQKVKYFCRTLTLDLLDRFPTLLSFVEAELTASPEVYLDFRNQFRRLIAAPLELISSTRSMILVIDALDNCEHQDRQILLQTLLEQLPQHPRLKVLLTSREAPDIVSTLANSPLVTGKDIQLHNVNQPAQEDIALYVHSRLSFFEIEERERIIKHSAGLFIWAATFCRAVGQSRLRARLLENLSHAKVTDPLDALYLGVLNQALIDIEAKPELKKVLQVIISAFQPVSINSLISFLPKIYRIDDFVQDLAGVIKDGHPDRPLKVLHPTFREFIASDEDRANGFVLQIEPSHSLLAAACLDLLGRSLKYDIFSLRRDNQVLPQNTQVQNLDQIITSSTTAALRYASSYWVQHLVAAEAAWVEWESVTRFLNEHFLHWVEFLSWQGTIGTAVSALARLNISLKRKYLATASIITSNDALAARHAHQFLTRYHSVIRESALHTYTAPAELLPPSSPLQRPSSKDESRHSLRILAREKDDWGSQIVLTGHRTEVLLVKLSPDASRAASVGVEGSFRLWDPHTGENIGPIVPEFKMHFGIRYAEFSPDSLKVAFASTHGQLHLWNAQTGTPIWEITVTPSLIAPAENIRIRFPPSQLYVALALYDRAAHVSSSAISQGTIRFYDIETGSHFNRPLITRDPCIEFYFSPDGRRCISNCVDRETHSSGGFLRIFDTQTSRLLKQMSFPENFMTGTDHGSAYSEDGTRIAVASGREPFILLDGDSGEQIPTVDKDEPPSGLVRFAPKGEYMVSIVPARYEPRITVWDKRNGTRLHTIQVDSGTALHELWISPDMRIAAHSNIKAIQVWDLETGLRVGNILAGTIPNGYQSDERPPVVLSKDWTTLLIRNRLDVDVYDLTTQAAAQSLPYKDWSVIFGAITANPLIFVGTASADEAKAAVWDASSGTPSIIASLDIIEGSKLGAIIAHRHQEVVFHARMDHPMVFFSLVSYQRVHRTLERERLDKSRKYAMSPDESLIVGACRTFIQVWAYTTGKLVWELPKGLIKDPSGFSEDGFMDNLVFSSDNALLCGSTHRDVYVVEMTSNNWWCLSMGDYSAALAIDSQRRLLAVAKMWGAVNLYHLSGTNIELASETPGIKKLMKKFPMAFSTDGQYLVHGSRVWKVKEDHSLEKYTNHIIPRSLMDYPHSFLTYEDGWIHSAFPPGPLVPIPTQQQQCFTLRDEVTWTAHKDVVLAWEAGGRPLLWDVSLLVSHKYD